MCSTRISPNHGVTDLNGNGLGVKEKSLKTTVLVVACVVSEGQAKQTTISATESAIRQTIL